MTQKLLPKIFSRISVEMLEKVRTGNTKGGRITVLLTSCLTGLVQSVLQMKTKIVSCHIADSKPVKQEVNGTAILPPLVFPGEKHLCANYFTLAPLQTAHIGW
jgi:hypothetical protein